LFEKGGGVDGVVVIVVGCQSGDWRFITPSVQKFSFCVSATGLL